MAEFLAVLDNREKAFLIWLLIGVTFLIVHKDIRQRFPPILKLIFATQIGIGLLVMVAYVSLILLIAHKLSLWNPSQLKTTVFWFFGTALVMLFSTNDAIKDDDYLKKVVAKNLRFAVVLSFVINLYVFNLFIELLLVPLLFLIRALIAFAGTKQEYAHAKRFTETIQAIIGIRLLIYVLTSLISNFQNFASLKNLRGFVLPIALTMALLPFMYMVTLYSAYESLFIRIEFWLDKKKELTTFTKRQILKTCSLRLTKVNRFVRQFA
ncbi:MAG: hypothetical protein ACRDJG_03655, partial [Actinomycetota bacterium]